MAWGKAGSLTLTTAGDSVDIGTITASETMNTMFHVINNGNTTDGTFRFNNNSSANYPNRWRNNGGTENTATNHTYSLAGYWGSEDSFAINYICNVSGEEKLNIMFAVGRGTAGNYAPNRREGVGKFTETTGQITDIEGFNEQAGSFDTDTNLTALGSELTPAAAVPAVPSLLYQLPSGSVGGWKELGRTTLSSSATNYEVASLANKRYLMVLVNNINAGQVEGDSLRFNNDTSANKHSGRYSNNGGADGTIVNKTKTNMFGFHPHTQPSFAVMNVANLSSKEKLGVIHAIGHDSNSSGSGVAPDRSEMVAKYSNTSDPISSIQQVTSWSTYNSGSEMVVLGWDPSDTHTTQFWEELGTVTQSSRAEATVSITSKKYLWIQYEATVINPTQTNLCLRFNEDSANNYARKHAQDGTNQSDNTNQNNLSLIHSGSSHFFGNVFIINNASNEKLAIIHEVGKVSASGGASEVPRRWEIAGKWANTSDQISSIQLLDSAQGSLGVEKCNIKVWGSD